MTSIIYQISDQSNKQTLFSLFLPRCSFLSSFNSIVTDRMAAEMSLGGEDIASILKAPGCIVTCVVLHASIPPSTSSVNAKPPQDAPATVVSSSSSSTSSPKNNDDQEGDDTGTASSGGDATTTVQDDNDDSIPYALPHLVSELSVDTSPQERAVEKALGGPFTFLGQYEDAGIVVMALRPSAEQDTRPLNGHALQPPLHTLEGVRGDILLMKVRGEDADEETTEFFQDLTREEYLAFAVRTDLVAVTHDEEEEEEDEDEEESLGSDDTADDQEGEEEEEGDDEDEDYHAGDHMEEMDEEDEKVGMLNILMGQILRRFQEDHGRGPERKELLQMRQALAQRLGVDVPPVSDDDEEEEEVDEENENDEGENDPAEHSVVDEENKDRNAGKKRSLENTTTAAATTIDGKSALTEDEVGNGSNDDDKSDTEEPKRKRVRWSIIPEENSEEECVEEENVADEEDRTDENEEEHTDVNEDDQAESVV